MLKHIFVYLCLAALFCCQTTLYGREKSDNLKPSWVTKSLPVSISGTYIFVRSHGTASTLAGAKQHAFVDMANRLEHERGLTVNTRVLESELFKMNEHETSTDYRKEVTVEVVEKGRKLEIVCRTIDDYWEKKDGEYHVDVLYTVTDKKAYVGSHNDDITLTTSYGAAGLLSIIPGAGQIYKGSVAKGSIILAGEVAAAGAILLCENTRAAYIKKMYEQPKHASEYNSLAEDWETGRNICIGAAAAIYVYNLVDAFVAKGARRVVVKPGRPTFQVSPYADHRSVGMGFTMKF